MISYGKKSIRLLPSSPGLKVSMESFTNRSVIDVREASVDDTPLLSIIAPEFFRDAFEDKMSTADLNEYLSTSLTYAVLEKELQDKHNIFFLAFSDNKLIGYAKLTTHLKLNIPKHDIELERLYIQKTWHGKGIGSRLMERCLTFSAKLGYKMICLAVWERNEQALHFYKKWEFVVSGEQIFMRGSDAQRGILLKKDINP
jgi:ribosomal protein S18 acetylase RimI-like enzyme